MDMISYSLSKKIAASAVSGVKSMSVEGQTLKIVTNDSGTLTMSFPSPKDGVSVSNIDVNSNNQIVFTMSDGTEHISGVIPTVKGDKGDPFKYSDFTQEQLESLKVKGDAGVSPTITENADNTDKIYKLDIETVDGKFTTPNLKGADCQGGSGGSGEENKIDSISVNGVNVSPDVNKNVDITVPDAYDDTDIRTELANKADIDHTHTTVNGHTVESDVPVDAKFTDTVYNDTQVKTAIQAVANGLMDSVGYSADYKTIDIIAKNGVKKSVNVAPIISHASITELSDVDTTNKATGKALVYNATTSKHEYADVSGTDEKVKMDASTDAKYLGELLDNVTIANENGELKVKKLDGQEVTITEINYLKGLTMNVMDLVNMFSNGGVKIINTPVATYAELLTLDKSSFIEGISYLVYVLADENHDNAKTTYLVDKDSETPTYFGFADSQRDFTTNPIDLATEITGKLGIANMDSDAIKALFTVDDTYKTETATNNAFSTHGAKALYDELLLAIGGKANDSDLTAHKDDTDIHVSTTEKDNWNGKADASDLTAHTGDSVIHVTAENKTLWNTVSNKVNKEDGKALLADTDKTNYDDAVTKAHTHENKEVLDGITSDKVTYWDNKSEFSGSYNDLNDKPTIDAELSNTSENAIQNKVVTKEINKLYSDISFNDFDTATDGISFTDAEDGNMLVTDWTKNLLNPTLETCEQNGVTCTRNVDANGKPDGTYTVNGTANAAIEINKFLGRFVLDKYDGSKLNCLGQPYGFSDIYLYFGFYDSNNRRLFELNPGTKYDSNRAKDCSNVKYIDVGMYGRLNEGKELKNVLIKPMITTDLNATYDDFVPYGGYEIQSCGKNLLDNVSIVTNTMNIEAKLTDDAGIKINGTTPSDPNWKDVYVECQATKLEKGKTYCLSVKDALDGLYIILRSRVYFTAYKELNLHDRFIIFTWDKDDKYIRYTLTVKSQQTFDNVTIYPQLEEVAPDATEPTAFEPYAGETITVTNETESPAFGLKSHKGITHIISPANVKCVYPTNESGKGVLDSLYNKDKMLTEQNKSLEVLGKCKNLLNPILETETHNGVTFTKNNDGTYSLSGSRTDTSSSAYISFIIDYPLEKGRYKLTGALDENNNIRCIIKESGSENKNIYDYGKGVVLDISKPNTTITLMIVSTDDTSQTRIIKPMLTTNLSATYDDFVPYTGDGKTLASDVAEIKNDLGGLTFSASGTTLSITDGTHTWTLEANS